MDITNLSRKHVAVFLCAGIVAVALFIAGGLLIAAKTARKVNPAEHASAVPAFELKGMHAAPFMHSASITDDTDRFTGVRSTNLHDMKLIPQQQFEEPLQIGAYFVKPTTPSGTVGLPRIVVLTFYSSSEGWRFLKFHRLDVLADGERVDVPEVLHRGDVVSGGVTEYMTVDLPVSSFIKIANAESVEMRLGGVELQLNSNHLEALRDLLSRAIEVQP